MTIVLAVGEALVDVVEAVDGTVTEHPGGSVANVAVALARLGDSVELATWLGDDARGLRVAEWLTAAGVTLTPGSTGAAHTSTAVAHLDQAGAATYRFDLDWHIPERIGRVAPTGLVHTGSLAAALEPGATAVAALVARARATATISFDPNVRPDLMGDAASARARIERWVAAADVVKASRDDLAWLYPERELPEVAAAWLASGPAVVVITCGADGAYAECRAGSHRARPVEVPVVDTVGAGDAFMGALLWSLGRAGLLGAPALPVLRAIGVDDLAEHVALASLAAGVSVGRAGADPPTLAELPAASGKVFE